MKLIGRKIIRTAEHDYSVSAYARAENTGFFAFYLRKPSLAAVDAGVVETRSDQVEGTIVAPTVAALASKCRALVEAASGRIITEQDSPERA